MSAQTHELFSKSWKVRVSDPGHEGSLSHYFETASITLTAYTSDSQVHYQYRYKMEDKLIEQHDFYDVESLFTFLGHSFSPVNLGILGIQLGKLGLA